jgi:hypothetical protein
MGSELSRLRDLPVWPEQVVGAKHVHSLEGHLGLERPIGLYWIQGIAAEDKKHAVH